MKIWPEGYLSEREDHEDPRVTQSSWNGIPEGANTAAGFACKVLLFASAHIFNEMRNMTKQMARIADALECIGKQDGEV